MRRGRFKEAPGWLTKPAKVATGSFDPWHWQGWTLPWCYGPQALSVNAQRREKLQ